MPLEFMRVVVDGQKVYGVIHWPKEVPAPLVIGSHGLFSSKESEKFVLLGELFSQGGIAFLRYDHRGCGESEGDIRKTTVSGRLEDLEAVFSFALEHPFVLKDRIGLLGSSLGGFISVIKASRDPRVKALCLWATPASLRGEVEEPLDPAFYEDARRWDAIEAIRRVKNCLILHGTADEVVPFEDAQRLYAAAQDPKELVAFEGGDHRFSDPESRLRAARLSLDWFRRLL